MQLYADNKELIDSEFALRKEKLLEFLEKNLRDMEEDAASHISGLSNYESNSYWKQLLDGYGYIHKKVRELMLAFERRDGLIVSNVDRTIREYKNKVVDELWTSQQRRYIGKRDECMYIQRRAAVIADLLEYAIKGAYYKSSQYNIEDINEKLTEEVCQQIDERIQSLYDYYYHKDMDALLMALACGDVNVREEATEILKSKKGLLSSTG